jgi:ubiquinone/menaquinone biosynthesis C-methylase UbiE
MTPKTELRLAWFVVPALAFCAFVTFGALGSTTVASAFQLAQRPAKEWIQRLERPERVASQKVDEIVPRLDLKPGMIVADIGAGTGVFSRPIARAVGPGGKVYAVDIEQELLDDIKRRADEQQITNIQPVLGEFDDPKLPARDVDLAFFNDVLHHIEHRAAYLKALATYIKPTGRIALVEFDKSMPQAEPASLLLNRAEVEQWLVEAGGFRPLKEFPELFQNKWFVIYGRN